MGLRHRGFDGDPGNLTRFGRSEADTDDMIQKFIRELFPAITLDRGQTLASSSTVLGTHR